MSPKTSNIYMLILLVWSVVFSFIMGILVLATGDMPGYGTLILLSQLFGLGLPFFVYILISRRKFTDIVPFRALGLTNALYVVAFAILAQPAMMLLSAVGSLFTTNAVTEMLSSVSDNMFDMIPMMVLSTILPPIFEEINFRGIILNGYKNAPLKVAVLINGLFFGIMHLNLQQFFYAFALGAVFALVVHYTKSIWAASLFHLIVNGSQMLLAGFAIGAQALAGEEMLADAAASGISETGSILIAIVGLIAIASVTVPIFVLLFIKFIKHNKQRDLQFEPAVEEKEITEIEENQVSAPLHPEEVVAQSEKKRFRFVDPAFIGVILFYIGYLVLTLVIVPILSSLVL